MSFSCLLLYFGGILEEACARILLIDYPWIIRIILGLSELGLLDRKVSFQESGDSEFQKERLSPETEVLSSL